MGILSQTKSASTVANDNAVGDKAWDSGTESYSLALDGNYTIIDLNPNKTSNYLKFSNFAFKIPKNAIIKGIKVKVSRFQNAATNAHDNIVKLVKAGIVVGDNKASSIAWNTTSVYSAYYGSNEDLWGTTWERSDVVDSGFGVVLSVTGTDGEIRVDHVDITVYYDVPKLFGVGISQNGVNILEATNLQKVFSSEFNTLKVYLKNELSVTTNGSGEGSGTVAHGLGYAPTFFVFRKGTASWQRNNAASIDSSSYSSSYFPNGGETNNWINQPEVQIYTDSSNLTISIIGANNTTYNFLYFIMADLAEEYDSDSPDGTHHYGIKVAQPGRSVLNKKDFQLEFSTRFRALEYVSQKSGTLTLTLPILFGSIVTDPTPESGVYGEVTHGMGYPPFYLAFVQRGGGSSLEEIPTKEYSALYDSGLGGLAGTIDSWCDATRIRFSFWRKAHAEAEDYFDSETITIKYLIFKEDLTELT